MACCHMAECCHQTTVIWLLSFESCHPAGVLSARWEVDPAYYVDQEAGAPLRVCAAGCPQQQTLFLHLDCRHG